MSDLNINIPKGRVHRTGRIEYAIYFALIFAFALPFAMVTWLAKPVISGKLSPEGPWAIARKDASAITPMIFRA